MTPLGKLPEDADLKNAKSAFHSTARQRLKGLQALGMEAADASSVLFDDLIEGVERSRQEQSPSPSSSSSSSSSSAPVQHIIAATGASAAQASKILLLKEEIARLRRKGLSTVTVVQQLQQRLQDAAEQRASWDENAEHAAWQAGGAASKKRRMGDESTSPPASAMGTLHAPRKRGWRMSADGPLVACALPLCTVLAVRPPHPHSPRFVLSCLTLPAGLSDANDNGELSRLSALPEYEYGAWVSPPCPADGKRQRDEQASLAQLKKLKLRPHEQPS